MMPTDDGAPELPMTVGDWADLADLLESSLSISASITTRRRQLAAKCRARAQALRAGRVIP